MIDPHLIARLYEQAHDSASAALFAGVLPRDIKETWPNVLGFLRRVPGQPYHRAAPNVVGDDAPTEAELEAFSVALRIHKRRAEEALERAKREGVEPTRERFW